MVVRFFQEIVLASLVWKFEDKGYIT